MFLGIILFLVSEVFLFGVLFWTYYYLRATTNPWPPAGVTLDLNLASINTFFLLASSGTMWWATNSIRKNKIKTTASALAITLALGIIFLGITGYEWLHESFRPWTHAYGSVFYTLTGFHALHVFIGVLLMIALLIRTSKNLFSSQRFLGLEIGSFYWHFVDFIWIFVFSSLFIIR